MPPRFRRGLLLGASGLTLVIALGVAHEAAAVNECGTPAGAPPSVTCKSTGNPYPAGITYDVEDLTIVVKSGVIVDTTTTTGEIGGIVSGGAIGTPAGSGNLAITVNSGVTILTDETEAPGVVVNTLTGTATMNSKANITASGSLFGAGLWAQSEIDDVTITAAGTITTSGDRGFGINAVTFGDDIISTVGSSATINTSGDYAFGIVGDTGDGKNADVFISSSGKITASGYRSAGLYSYTHGTDADITITNDGPLVTSGAGAEGIRAITNGNESLITVSSSGKIATSGSGGDGIYAAGRYDNSGIVITSSSRITTSGEGATGIDAVTLNGGSGVTVDSNGAISTIKDFSGGISVETLGAGSAVSVESDNTIRTSGNYAYGIGVNTVNTAAPVTIVSNQKITTGGRVSFGIYANAFSNIAVTSTDRITTAGEDSHAIRAVSGAGGVTVTAGSVIGTSNRRSDGIHAEASAGDVAVTSTATIKTSADDSYGIWARAPLGGVAISSGGPVTTTGASSDAVHADATDITLTVGDASASGQGSDGIDAANANDGVMDISVTGKVSGGWGQGQGVRVKATDPASLAIGTAGSVGALSDFAVSEGGDDMSIINKGTITGYVDLSAGADSLINASSGAWDLREFADTNGDGKRDAEGIAFANFGSGIDSFDNVGTLSLGKAVGATTFDTTGAIVDPHGTDGDMTLSGVEQGQFIGLEQFTNSGIITLQDGKTGDFLAITDKGVAGPGGGGVFISNGGSLHLDVRLDDGSSGKADMLFLDIAKSGVGGGTQVFVTKAGGAGALTKGDGIEVIHVDVSSTSDAFTLGAPVVAGAFEYDLEFQNLAATDQNWYLRSHPFAAAAAYPAIASSALTTFRADLGSLEDRMSDLRLQMTAPSVTMPVTVAGIAEGGSITLDPARFAGGWFNVTSSDEEVAQSGVAGFSQETSRAQMGFDLALDNVFGHDDWLVVGAFGGQGWSEADFNDADSTADFDIAAMGVYASYFRGPYHFDALVKFDWLDGDYNSDVVTGGGDVTLPVFGVSLNTGYRFDLTRSGSGGLSLQPVAALDYAHVGGDTFEDDSGATIELMETDSLRGRLGARLVQQLLPSEDGTGPVGNFYFEAGIAQEFLGESQARVTGVTLTQELPRTTFELGAGFDVALPADGVSFTFDTSAGFSEGEDNFGATGGVKFTW